MTESHREQRVLPKNQPNRAIRTAVINDDDFPLYPRPDIQFFGQPLEQKGKNLFLVERDLSASSSWPGHELNRGPSHKSLYYNYSNSSSYCLNNERQGHDWTMNQYRTLLHFLGRTSVTALAGGPEVSRWGKPVIWFAVKIRLRFVGVPLANWYPLHRLPTKTNPQWRFGLGSLLGSDSIPSGANGL
jgi:hypothetical protein